MEVRNYLIGQCSDCEPLLDFAERHNGVITLEAVDRLAGPQGHLALDLDPRVVSGHIWTWLGIALKGKAKGVYNTGGRERVRNGLEAWRKIYAHIINGVKLHNMGLRDQVFQPKEVRNYHDVNGAISDWESIYRDYLDTDGRPMTPYEEKMTVLKILPAAMRDNMLWRAMG